jgi:DNA-binding LytR/AlgR family response regulator
MINCIIVDDEPLARQMIRMHLSQLSNWCIVQECVHALEAYEALHRHDVQVMFLDIQMPHLKGNDFLRSLRKPPLIVFTTAYADYALEGFELNAVDYLLKPITFDRFRQAVEKVHHQLSLPPGDTAPAITQPAPLLKEDFIFIKQDNRQVKVSYQDILFLEAKRDFTKIYLRNKTLLAGFHLKMLEDLLPASLFLRVHRSYMVSLPAITAVYGNTVEIEGHQVPVSPGYREALNAALKL